MVKRKLGPPERDSGNLFMAYCLNAAHLFCEDDGYMIMLGFADDEFEPSKFVILQQSHEYDDQDKKLGMGKLHIQVEDQSRSQYGGVKAVNVTGDKVSISLDEAALSSLKVDGDLEISFSSDHPNVEAVISQLENMLKRDGVNFSK